MDRLSPKVGVHPRVPALVYHHGWRALSRSILEEGRKSMAHLKERMDTPPGDTPALLIGRAIHAAILEPDEFATKYTGIDVDRRTKIGKAEWEVAVEHFGVEYVLKGAEFERCKKIRDAVWAKKSASTLLGSEGDVELSLAWNDPLTSLLCKSRLDRTSYKIAGGTVVDLKSTRAANLVEFERSIFTLGYHRQAGMYIKGLETLGVAIRNYVIIAVEKEPPYAVAVYRLADSAIEEGWNDIQPILQRVVECRESDKWPDYPDEVIDITLPTWAWDKSERERLTA